MHEYINNYVFFFFFFSLLLFLNGEGIYYKYILLTAVIEIIYLKHV